MNFEYDDVFFFSVVKHLFIQGSL